MNEPLNFDDSVASESTIKVFCAWCNKYLYSVVSPHKEEYSNSHGICKECMKKYFDEVDE